MITLSFTEAMARVQKQFSCDRKEAYKLMNELIAREHFKLEEEKDA